MQAHTRTPRSSRSLAARQHPAAPSARQQTSRRRQPRCRAAPAFDLAIELSPASLILPGVAVLAGAAGLKFWLYTQLEVITASMLTKYVPKGGPGAKVVQLGGGTRELYYYPKDTMTVINVGEGVNKGLMEQAGVTAAVPTLVKQQPVTDLRFQPDASVDAVVDIGQLSQLGSRAARAQALAEAARVLKPGKPLVFIEPVSEGGSPLRGLIGLSSQRMPAAELEALGSSAAWSYAQFDQALASQDPHAVGVAVRSEAALTADPDERDGGSKRSRRSKQPKAAKGFTS